ncbi:hypothetical protein FSARC_2066 [Fusarium sarcochroum]|uniref:Uncharacterized protein n=1 Tax=Fusarium sarcochroum TaxID=1208366 RepID=A0A8H4U703_9HYPO|nr:hypothetical protein FSARC_2066 [Fusarium sarcochroum]
MAKDPGALYPPDPPGDIAETWNKSYAPLSDPWPYPMLRSPIVPSTMEMDDDWLLTSRQIVVFYRSYNKHINPGIRQQKDDHMQFFFWTALDRANRRWKDMHAPNQRLWEFHDMRGMLSW